MKLSRVKFTVISIGPMSEVTWEEFIELEKLIFPNNPMTRENFKIIRNHDGFVGLFQHSMLLGYLYIKRYGNTWHIKKKMGINPQYQSKGYGSELLKWAISYCYTNNAKSISLYVRSSNDPAVLLYEKWGFKIHGTTEHYKISSDAFIPNITQTGVSDYQLTEMQNTDIEDLISAFPVLSSEVLKNWMETNQPDQLLILRYQN